jgi:hypothetical protein
MERKFFWGAAIVSVLIFVATFFMQGSPADKTDFPWNIEHPTTDTSRIFGLTLGQSNSKDAEQRFKEEAKPILFKSPSGQLSVEVFFEDVRMAALKARIVLIVDVPKAELKGMFDRGLRMNATGSGKEITLSTEDAHRVLAMPISSLTYMPGVRLEDAIFEKRFGQPEQRIREKKSGAIHWLYPRHGLDITLGGKEKPLLQYVSPKDFDKLTNPLVTQGEVVK